DIIRLFFYSLAPHPDPPPSPTRRSSDLTPRSPSAPASASTCRRSCSPPAPRAGGPAAVSAAFAAPPRATPAPPRAPRCDRGSCRSEEHTSELQSLTNLVCRLLLEKHTNA